MKAKRKRQLKANAKRVTRSRSRHSRVQRRITSAAPQILTTAPQFDLAPIITIDEALKSVAHGCDISDLVADYNFADPVLGEILRARGTWHADDDGEDDIWTLKRSAEIAPEGVEPLWISIGATEDRLGWNVYYPGDGSNTLPDEFFASREDLVAQLDRIEAQPDPMAYIVRHRETSD